MDLLVNCCPVPEPCHHLSYFQKGFCIEKREERVQLTPSLPTQDFRTEVGKNYLQQSRLVLATVQLKRDKQFDRSANWFEGGGHHPSLINIEVLTQLRKIGGRTGLKRGNQINQNQSCALEYRIFYLFDSNWIG